MRRRPAHLRWRRPLALLFGLTAVLALDGSGVLRVGLGCALLHEPARTFKDQIGSA